MLTPANSALVVVDVQERLASAMHERTKLFQNLEILIQGAQVLGIPIIATEQAPEKLGKTIPEIVRLFDNFQPIPKISFSCCGAPEFQQKLKEVNAANVVIAGIEAHVCVYQTVRDLIYSTYKVQVVEDAVSSRTAENKAIGLKRIEQEGGGTTSVETVLCELLGEAKGENFKKVLKLIK